MSKTKEWLDIKIREANYFHKKFRELCHSEGKALDVLLEEADELTNEDIVYLIDNLPSGFHRTELRVILKNRNAGLE